MTAKHQDQIESIKAYERATKVLREKRTRAFSNIIKGFCRIHLSICLNFLLKSKRHPKLKIRVGKLMCTRNKNLITHNGPFSNISII